MTTIPMTTAEKHILDNLTRNAMNTLERLYNLTGDEDYWRLRTALYERMLAKIK